MIYDNIKNLSVYHALPGIAAAEAFLAGSDLSSLTAGKIQLGGGVVVNVNIYEPKTDPKFEAHRNYIDLQYVYDGDEDMECALMDDALDAGEYNAQKDIQFFGAAKAGRCGRMAFTDRASKTKKAEILSASSCSRFPCRNTRISRISNSWPSPLPCRTTQKRR